MAARITDIRGHTMGMLPPIMAMARTTATADTTAHITITVMATIGLTAFITPTGDIDIRNAPEAIFYLRWRSAARAIVHFGCVSSETPGLA